MILKYLISKFYLLQILKPFICKVLLISIFVLLFIPIYYILIQPELSLILALPIPPQLTSSQA